MVVGDLLAVGAARWPMSNRAAIAVRRQRDRKALPHGFTLLEVLIVVSIAAILLAIGIPSFQNTILSNRLTATANVFVSAYNSARLTAIQRNAAVQFCSGVPSLDGSETLGAACGSETGGAFILNANGTSAAKVVQGFSLPAGITLDSHVALRFNGQGFARAAVSGTGPYTGLLLGLSSSQSETNNRRCIYLTTGSIISVCSASGTGACNASEPASCG